MKDLFIIDASGYLYSSYYAIRNMTNAEGKSTNALFGFIRAVTNIIRDFKTENVLVVFDGPNNTASRKALYSEYKANRKTAPDDLSYQFPWAEEFCRLRAIPYLKIPNVEADDTMGTAALFAEKQGAKVYLCSSDKDLCQFVNEKISMLYTRKENSVLGPKEVEESFGIPPNLIIDYLTMVGDASDNVPGFSGIGPKTAAELLKEYGSLNNILNNLNSFSGKRKEILLAGKEQAAISRKLLEINTSVAIPNDLSFYRLGTPHMQALKEFYQQKNFRTFYKELEEGIPKQEREIKPSEEVYTLVDNEENFTNLLKTLQTHKEIAFDIETTSIRPMDAELIGLGFSVEEGKAFYVPCNGKLGKKKVLDSLKPLFEDKNHGFFGHNTKYNYHVLENEGIKIAYISFDTLLASYILNAHERGHSLDSLALERFGKVMITIESLIGKGKHALSMKDVPLEKISNHSCENADYTFRLKQLLAKELKERKLEGLFFNLELPLLRVLARMERRGIYLDAPLLKSMGDEIKTKLASLEKSVYQATSLEFNLNSPKQIADTLMGLGVKLPKKTATGFSTSAEILESIKEAHPAIPFIIEYRLLEKLRSTYIDALPEEINQSDHRIHCNFNQTIAATGRLSSQDPNLQNIPIRSEISRKIRRAFRPQKEGWTYLSSDYSQIELRLLAHLSEDPNLIHAFEKGEDIHRHTASQIFNVHLEFVTREMRSHAKAVNFGVIYGQGPVGLSKNLGITRAEAAHFIETYFKQYPKVKGFVNECIEKSRQTKRAVTMTGRERLIPEINSTNAHIRSEAERLAINTPLQGSAADLIKAAMIELDQHFSDEYMILQIHDELLFEIPDEKQEEISLLVKKVMEGIWKLKVPLIVDISIGKNWEECYN